MIIHVVKEGDTLYKIGKMYNVDYQKIASDNEIAIDKDLVVGQTIVIVNNNVRKQRSIVVNGYVFPNIDKTTFEKTLPYLTYVSIFSYSVNNDGTLNPIDDNELIEIAKKHKVMPIMVITNIGTEGRFNSDIAHTILSNEEIQNKLIINVLNIMHKKGYRGLDIDFEYVYPEDEKLYINFINKIDGEIARDNYFLAVAVAPKTSDEQQGLLYEAHNYRKIGQIADHIILMTYEWGYSGGPAMAVSPFDSVTKVLDYTITRIPPNKILLGIPTYGYDWTLPYKEGDVAESIGNSEAVDIARAQNQAISFNDEDKAPYFNYYDSSQKKHEVWFEDARSIQSMLELVLKYNLEGISFWTINRFYPPYYLILNSSFSIKKY